MALPKTGSISMSQVRTELKLSGAISLGDAKVRALAGRKTGSISLSHLQGKSAASEIIDVYVDVLHTVAGKNKYWDGFYTSATTSNVYGSINPSTINTLRESNGVRKTMNIVSFGIYSSKSKITKPRTTYFRLLPSGKPEWNPTDVPTVLYVRMLNPTNNVWTAWGTINKDQHNITYDSRSESAAGLKDIQAQISSLSNKKVRFQLKIQSGYKFVS